MMNSVDLRSDCCVQGTELNAPPWEMSMIIYFSFSDEEDKAWGE